MIARKECVNKYENFKIKDFDSDRKSRDFRHEQDCPCEDIDCSRHGICCECIAHHRANKERPAYVRNQRFLSTIRNSNKGRISEA